jgi:cytochrome c oxidase cbb3-type subunit 1
MADCAWFTYGRIHAAHLNALAYGFAAQAGLGVTLWLLAQTGKARLALPGGSFIAAKLWNLGVLLGVVSILAGNNTGFDFLEFSQAGSVILFIAYLILALAGLLTFARRTEKCGAAPSFLVVALFWFPWIYLTATALLGCKPVRGVAQAVIAWWFVNNFLFVWLGLIGLGALFYFIPKLSGRPLHSRQMASFALCGLIFFGSWAGIPAGAPLPAWLPALSSVGAFLSVITLLAVLVNFKQTAGKCLCTKPEAVQKFIGISVWMFAAYVVGTAVTSINSVAEVTAFTWLAPALTQLLLYGFIGMVLLGAIYHIAPQLTQSEYVCTKPLKFHFWFALGGTVLLVGSLAVAGLKQGRLLNDPGVLFADVTKAAMMPFRLSTVGDLAILLGALTLLFNLGGLLRGCCKLCGGGSRETKTAEVKK